MSLPDRAKAAEALASVFIPHPLTIKVEAYGQTVDESKQCYRVRCGELFALIHSGRFKMDSVRNLVQSVPLAEMSLTISEDSAKFTFKTEGLKPLQHYLTNERDATLLLSECQYQGFADEIYVFPTFDRDNVLFQNESEKSKCVVM